MNYFYFDPSALIKRYHVELGTENVDYLLDKLLAEHPVRITTSVWSIPETIAALNRRKNEQQIPDAQFSILLLSFLNETRTFEMIDISEDKLFRSINLILQHNLNSADALHLVSIQDAFEVVSLSGNSLIVVVSDKRLLRAVRREGFTTLNPELDKLLDKMLFTKFFLDFSTFFCYNNKQENPPSPFNKGGRFPSKAYP